MLKPGKPTVDPRRFVCRRSDFLPAYRRAHLSGLLLPRIAAALDRLSCCCLCPRRCRADRLRDRPGVCRTGRRALVASAFPHLGEEAPLRGWRGSGTIFFGQCNLRCVFCQNDDISHVDGGREVDAAGLAALMLGLQAAGCHNINLVTPSHVVPQILESLPIAVEGGLNVPLVYNSGGYDSAEALRLMEGVVDIFMPDFKFWSESASRRWLTAEDYPGVAREALRIMHGQVGDLHVDERGLAVRGLLVRHLVMPGALDETRQILDFVAQEISPDTYVNVMGQYHPAGRVPVDRRFADINRPLTYKERERAREMARDAGLWRLDGDVAPAPGAQ